MTEPVGWKIYRGYGNELVHDTTVDGPVPPHLKGLIPQQTRWAAFRSRMRRTTK